MRRIIQDIDRQGWGEGSLLEATTNQRKANCDILVRLDVGDMPMGTCCQHGWGMHLEPVGTGVRPCGHVPACHQPSESVRMTE
jgi:hypothetical protein